MEALDLADRPGTYALVLRNDATAEVTVGRWGALRVDPGWYVYVGSAFGPGGVRARVGRHFSESGRRHWHIDYLRSVMVPERAWCSFAPTRLEHDWAGAFSELPDYACIPDFGSSDCHCDGHLFATSSAPDNLQRLPVAVVGSGIEPFHRRTA